MREVGEVDGGLAAASWSPDGELLVLVSGEGKLIVMNKVVTVTNSHEYSRRMLLLPG